MQRKLVSPASRRTLTAIVVCLGPLARAEAPRPPIVLVLDPCASVDAQEVRRLVPIEMGAPLVPAAGDDTTRVSVGCVAGSQRLVRLEVRDPTTGRSLERVVTLEGVSKADRARLVAIASVELVAASASGQTGDLSSTFGLAAPPSDAPVIAAAAPPPRAPAPPRWRLLAQGSVRHFAGLPRLLPGADVAVDRALPRGLGLAADVAVEGFAQPTDLGDVDALVASAGLVATVRGARGRLAWETGAGVRGGLARLAGEGGARAGGAVTAGTVAEPWGGPLVAGRLTLALGRTLVASLGAELGYVTSQVVGLVDGRSGLGVRGTFWSATLGVGVAR
jgi:hypothetical protein